MIKGITVQLLVKKEIGKDPFNSPIIEEQWINVDNVLIGEPSPQEITDSYNVNGKHLAYTLGIPKGDKNVWEDAKVVFFGKTFHTFGPVSEGIESLIPLDWNKKVKVERYE